MRAQVIRTIPPKEISHIIKEYMCGVGIRIRNSFIKRNFHLDGLKVKSFFVERSKNEDFSDFTESTSIWYLSGLESHFIMEHLKSFENIKIIDLGCGRAGLLQWLRKRFLRPFTYLGIDFDDEAIRRCEESFSNESTKFRVADLEHNETNNTSNCDVLFIVNLLPYIDDTLSFFKNTITSFEPLSIIIIDPYPSPFWEEIFGGFKIKIRHPTLIEQSIEVNNYVLNYSEKNCVLKYRNKGYITINTTQIWKKK